MDDQLRKWEEGRFSGKTDNYWYSQTKESICVRVPTKGTGGHARDFAIKITPVSVRVASKKDGTVLCEGVFPSRFRGAGLPKGKPLRVRVDECIWTLEDGVVSIDLEKYVGDFWHSLFEGQLSYYFARALDVVDAIHMLLHSYRIIVTHSFLFAAGEVKLEDD